MALELLGLSVIDGVLELKVGNGSEVFDEGREVTSFEKDVLAGLVLELGIVDSVDCTEELDVELAGNDEVRGTLVDESDGDIELTVALPAELEGNVLVVCSELDVELAGDDEVGRALVDESDEETELMAEVSAELSAELDGDMLAVCSELDESIWDVLDVPTTDELPVDSDSMDELELEVIARLVASLVVVEEAVEIDSVNCAILD